MQSRDTRRPGRRSVLTCWAALAAAGPWDLIRAQSLPAVRVASKIDTEGLLLGEMIVRTLRAHGVRTESRLQLGPTQIVRSALISGEIDLYPEYTGNGALFFADEKNPAWKDAAAGYARVKRLDLERNQLVWLQPSPANNTWVIAVRQDLARSQKLSSMADLGRYVAGGGKIRLAASAEFVERSDALPAFQAAYGFRLRQDQLLVLAGGDTSVTIRAAAEQTSGVNAAMAYGTDGPLAALGLVILDDTRAVQPVYAPAPVIRAAVLEREPKIAVWMAALFRTLDAPTLQRLNAQVALEGLDARKVAESYLSSKGIVP